MSATTNEWESAVATAGCAAGVLRRPRGGQRGDRHRLPRLLARQPVLDPQLLRGRAHERARGAHRADHGDVGGDQQRLARAASASATGRPRARSSRSSCAGCRNRRCASTARPTAPCCATTPTGSRALGVYMERADNTARILDVKYHLLLPAAGACRRPARLFPVGRDPALGLGAHRLSLGLSREPQALADRRPADPQRADAALARELLREPRRRTSTASPRAYGRQGPAQRQRALRSARGSQNSRMDEIFQSGLHEFIGAFIADNNRLGARLPSNICFSSGACAHNTREFFPQMRTFRAAVCMLAPGQSGRWLITARQSVPVSFRPEDTGYASASG